MIGFRKRQRTWQFILLLMLSAAGPLPFSSCTTLIESKDHRPGQFEENHPNAFLWRRVGEDPAVFHPRDLPDGFAVTPETGDWIVDPQDRAAFFVPNEECGGLSSKGWRIEAMKAVNRRSKGEQFAWNAVTVLVGWPAYTAATMGAGLPGG